LFNAASHSYGAMPLVLSKLNGKGRITAVYRVRQKPYSVLLEINETEKEIVKSVCEDCPAAAGKLKILSMYVVL